MNNSGRQTSLANLAKFTCPGILLVQSVVGVASAVAQPPANWQTASVAKPVWSETSSPAGPSNFIQLAPIQGRQYSPVITALASDRTSQTLVAAGDDHAIRWIDIGSGKTQLILEGHTDWVRRVAFMPTLGKDLRLLSCGDDGKVILWAWNADDPRSVQKTVLLQTDHTLTALAIDPQAQRVCVGGFSNDIFICSLESNKLNNKFHCECGDQRDFVFTRDGQRVIAGGRDGAVHVFNVQTGKLEHDYHLHRGRLRSLTLDASGKILTSVGEDRVVNQINWETGETLVSTKLRSGKLLALELIDDERMVAAGADNTVQVLDRRTGGTLNKLVGHDGSVAMMLRHDGYLITAGFDTTIRLWDISTFSSSAQDSAPLVHPVRSRYYDSGVNEPTY